MWILHTKKSVKVGPILTPLPKESRNMGQMGRKLGKNQENLWKMGIKSEQKLGKSLNKHGFPFSWECVRVLWRYWPHIVKLNEWTSVTAIIILVNYCPMTCRLCYEYRRTLTMSEFTIYSGLIPVQRHITGVLENTRVFDEKYPGIFQYSGFIDKYPGIFHQIPGYLTACQIPG